VSGGGSGETGLEPQLHGWRRLPLLAVYLGHESLLGTEVYLTATPELLALAGQRFAARVFDRRRSR